MTQTKFNLSVLLHIALMMLVFANHSLAVNTDPKSTGDAVPSFEPSDNDLQRVQDALERASQNDKLALVVLGANWCHDSTGFLSKSYSPEVKPILDQNFETVLIDLGNYDDKTAITAMFDYPIYFGTPTVMVVEPNSKRLLNEDSLSLFNQADSLELDEYQRYFSAFDGNEPSPLLTRNSVVEKSALSAFEEQHIQRLLKAYEYLAPMMAAEDAGQLEDKSEFYSAWNEVKSYRFELQKDIFALRYESREDFPRYPAFSWE